MLKTYPVKHGMNLDPSLFEKAQQVALYAQEHGDCSSKCVKHIGLHSGIACQILRKYGNNKKLKNVRLAGVKLIVDNQRVRFDKDKGTVWTVIKGLRRPIKCYFHTRDIVKINQIEFDPIYAYVTVTLPDVQERVSEGYMGIDLNSTSHSIVVACPATGKVLMPIVLTVAVGAAVIGFGAKLLCAPANLVTGVVEK